MTSPTWVWLTQHLIPKNLSSAVVYKATRSRSAWLKRPLTRWFANAYGVDMTEAANADLESYATFNDFFTRELKAGARPIASGADTIAAPADGVLTEHGAIDGDRLQHHHREDEGDQHAEDGDAVRAAPADRLAEEARHDRADQRQHRHGDEQVGRKCRCHAQPLSESSSSTLIEARLRNSTTRIASPMADSAAATVRMKNTNTWPWKLPK